MIDRGATRRVLCVAGASISLGLAVSAAGMGQVDKFTATQPLTTSQRTTELHAGKSARPANPEAEFDEALALRNRLSERNLRTAAVLFIDSARQFASSGEPQQAAAAELEAGDVYLMMSSYQQAIAAYRYVVNLSGARAEQTCSALTRLARTYSSVGRAKDAQSSVDRAASVCMGISDKRVLAAAEEAQGEARFRAGNLSDAKAYYTRAKQLASEAGDRNGQALAEMMLSLATDDHDEADRLAWSALESFVAAGDEYYTARARLKLAYFAINQGNFEAARCQCESALPVFQRIGDKDDEAIALNILGLIAVQSGELEEALSHYQRARKQFAYVHDDLGEAESLGAIAEILTNQKKYEEVAQLYVSQLRLAHATSHRSFLAQAELDMAGVYARQKRYGPAEDSFQRALAEFRLAGNHDGESDTLERMAEFQAEQGKYHRALQTLGEAQVLREQSGEIEDLARIQYARARIYRRLNQLEEARSEIEKTIAIIESQRLRIARFDSRAQYFSSVHDYYSMYIQVLMGLDKIHPDQHFAQLAFEAAERSKVRSLVDLLATTQERVDCRTFLVRDSSRKSGDEVQVAADAATRLTTQSLTLNNIQTLIGDGQTVLVEFALDEERSVVWVVDDKVIRAFDIGPAAEIRNCVRTFRKALLPVEGKPDETPSEYLRRRESAKNALLFQSRRLGKVLFGPVDIPADKRLLIVPDGPLQYVPFAALTLAGKRDTGIPLIELHELAMLPSASTLATLRKTAAKRAEPADEVTIFADPIFEPPGKTAPAAITRSSGLGQPRELTRALRDLQDTMWIPSLPGSRNEALAIRHITGAARTRLVLVFDANREAVMAPSISRQRIIHFATHGMVDTRNPDMSGLVLSLFNQKGEEQDGYLRLSDIYKLKLSADLVVLSSCESALGKDLGSEGMFGLPRAFLYAGARSVLASLWKVDDDAAVPLMKTFYSRLQRGGDPARALRDAQLHMINDPRFSNPYYWAAFVLEGDYR